MLRLRGQVADAQHDGLGLATASHKMVLDGHKERLFAHPPPEPCVVARALEVPHYRIQIIKPLPASQWRPLPDKEFTRSSVLAAHPACKATNTNPCLTPVVVDAGAGLRFRSFRVGSCPCITKTCGGNVNGYWRWTTGGCLTIDELAMLPGSGPSMLDWRGAGLTPSQCGQCLGKAQPLNVAKAIVLYLLYLSRLIGAEDFNSIVH